MNNGPSPKTSALSPRLPERLFQYLAQIRIHTPTAEKGMRLAEQDLLLAQHTMIPSDYYLLFQGYTNYLLNTLF